MKNVLLFLFMTCLTFPVFANYEKAMYQGLKMLGNAESTNELEAAALHFERIGASEATEWLPSYYSALCYIKAAIADEEKDQWLDKAQASLDVIANEDNNSEVLALQGYLHMIRLTVDPAARGQKYTTLTNQYLGKALSIEPDNPRANLLKGQMELGTASFFGKESTEACQYIEKAMVEFTEDGEERTLAPTWGKAHAEALMENCK